MATVHRDGDLGLLSGKVAVIGYGSQGHAHALNLRDSGIDVVVGLREGSGSRAAAEEAGLVVASPAEAVNGAQLVAFLLPDQVQPAVYAEVAPHLDPGAALLASPRQACPPRAPPPRPPPARGCPRAGRPRPSLRSRAGSARARGPGCRSRSRPPCRRAGTRRLRAGSQPSPFLSSRLERPELIRLEMWCRGGILSRPSWPDRIRPLDG